MSGQITISEMIFGDSKVKCSENESLESGPSSSKYKRSIKYQRPAFSLMTGDFEVLFGDIAVSRATTGSRKLKNNFSDGRTPKIIKVIQTWTSVQSKTNQPIRFLLSR